MTYVLWLCTSETTELDQLILDIAQDLGHTPFPAHITLIGSVETDTPQAYWKAIQKASADMVSISLTLDEWGEGDSYWQCFYLKVHPELIPITYHNALAYRLRSWGTSTSPYHPHLSMVYGHLSEEDIYSLLARYPALAVPRTYLFDTLRLVEFWEADISRWRVVEEWTLPAKLPWV